MQVVDKPIRFFSLQDAVSFDVNGPWGQADLSLHYTFSVVQIGAHLTGLFDCTQCLQSVLQQASVALGVCRQDEVGHTL